MLPSNCASANTRPQRSHGERGHKKRPPVRVASREHVPPCCFKAASALARLGTCRRVQRSSRRYGRAASISAGVRRQPHLPLSVRPQPHLPLSVRPQPHLPKKCGLSRTWNRRSSSTSCNRPSSRRLPCCTCCTAGPLPGNGRARRRRFACCGPRTPHAFPR